MEDAHIAQTNLGDTEDAAIFGVFDGHGGRCACHVHAGSAKLVRRHKLGAACSGQQSACQLSKRTAAARPQRQLPPPPKAVAFDVSPSN